jgi:AcrR family transcriptional regulator
LCPFTPARFFDSLSLLTDSQFLGSIGNMKDITNKPDPPEHGRVARRRARVRADLLAAARQVFVARGYQDATITEIVQLADVAMGTFYLHFRDKEEIFVAIVEGVQQTIGEQIQEAIVHSPDEPIIPLLIRTLLRAAFERRDLFLLICAGDGHLLAHVSARRAQEGLARHFIPALEAVRANGELSPFYDLVLLADLIVGMLIRALNWWFEQAEPGPEAMAEHILGLLAHGLPSSLFSRKEIAQEID